MMFAPKMIGCQYRETQRASITDAGFILWGFRMPTWTGKYLEYSETLYANASISETEEKRRDVIYFWELYGVAILILSHLPLFWRV